MTSLFMQQELATERWHEVVMGWVKYGEGDSHELMSLRAVMEEKTTEKFRVNFKIITEYFGLVTWLIRSLQYLTAKF